MKIDYHFFRVNSKEAMKLINHPLQLTIPFRSSEVKDDFIIIQIQHWRWFFNFLIFYLLPQIPYELEWTHRHNEVNRNAVRTPLHYYTYFNDFMILLSLHILFGRQHKYNKCKRFYRYILREDRGRYPFHRLHLRRTDWRNTFAVR